MESIAVLGQPVKVSAAMADYLGKAFRLPADLRLTPPVDDAQVPFWEDLITQAEQSTPWTALQAVFPQLRFPIQAGLSQSQDYRAAVLRGKDAPAYFPAQGLTLENPTSLKLCLHPSPAGKIPVLSVASGHDFAAILQALAYKNEPQPIPASMGAILIKGLTNWSRLAALKQVWQNSSPQLPWPLYFKEHLAPQKDLYQDQLIVLSRKPYSGVRHQQLGLSEAAWLEHSFSIRLHHECAHYFTQKYLGGMHLHLHDEVLADYMGLVQTLGEFPLNWFLTFLGVEGDRYRPGGRMENYLLPELRSPQHLEVLRRVLQAVGHNLAKYQRFLRQTDRVQEFTLQLLNLASHSLADLAGEGGFDRLKATHSSLAESLAGSSVSAR